MWKFLRQEHDLRSISPQEAQKLAEKGDFVIVDVRPANLHEQARVNDSANAPLFQQVDWSKPSFTKVSHSAGKPVSKRLQHSNTSRGLQHVNLCCVPPNTRQMQVSNSLLCFGTDDPQQKPTAIRVGVT